MVNSMELPKKIYLAEYGGNYERYVDAVYEVFERDFIRHRAMFGSHGLRMKYHPEFQGRAYTFYHMTIRERWRVSGCRICADVSVCLGPGRLLKMWSLGDLNSEGSPDRGLTTECVYVWRGMTVW